MQSYAEIQEELAAKVRLLDKLFALYEDDKVAINVGDWDLNFIINMKDWIDKKERPITEKQARKIKQIFDKYDDNQPELEPRFGIVWDWRKYLGKPTNLPA